MIRATVAFCLLILATASAFASPATDHTPDTQRIAPLPEADLVLWPQYEGAELKAVLVSPSSDFVAVREGESRFRIWRLLDGRQLTGPVFDSNEAGVFASALTWCGECVAYVSCPSPEEMWRVDRGSPEGGMAAYLTRNTRVDLLDPATGQSRTISPSGYMDLLGSNDGSKLALFEPYAHWDELDKHLSWSDVIGLPDRGIIAHRMLHTGMTILGSGNLARPLSWDPSRAGLFLLGETDAAILPGTTITTTLPVLIYAPNQGEQRDLSNTENVRLRPGTEGLTVINDGQMIGAFLSPFGTQMSGVGLFNRGGLVHRYSFSVRSEFPPALRRLAPRWQPIACTPDGKCALFQAASSEDGEGAQLCLWHLSEERVAAVIHLPAPLSACIGWAGANEMVVAVKADTEGAYIGARDYGILRLPQW